MKVILQKTVPGLGDMGEISDVADGYARNYLLPRKLVVSAHAGSVRALEHQKRIIEIKNRKRKSAAQALSEKLSALASLEIEVKVGAEDKLFGSVTTANIASLLGQKGFAIDRRKIELTDKIRTVGTFPIRIHLAEGIDISLPLQVVPDADSIKKAKQRAIQEEKQLSKQNDDVLEESPEQSEGKLADEKPTDEKLTDEKQTAPSAIPTSEEKGV